MFHVSTLKETEYTNALHCIKQFANIFHQIFPFTLVIHRNNVEGKNYPAVDLPVYEESSGADFISVQD